MALQVVSPSVSVYKVTGVVEGQQQTEDHVFKRGELLPNWVDAHQQFVLSQTGMARQVGDFPDPTLVAAEDMPAPVVLPEHSQLSVLGTPVTQPMAVTARVTPADRAGQGGDAGDGSLPADGDTKPEWERAAVRLGVPRGEAESMRKADLVKEVKNRQAEKDKAAKADAAEQEKVAREGDDTMPPTFAKGGRVAEQPTVNVLKAPDAKTSPKAGQ